tara:strand:- start:8253 stop:8801 length:549 start_codon:yes stop_codon:yes gene_type:complete
MFDIPIIGPALDWAFDSGSEIVGGVSDFFFGSDDEFYSTDDGLFSKIGDLFSSEEEISGSFLDTVRGKRQSQKQGGVSPLDVYNAKQLTQLRRLSTQRAKQEAAKNLQRALPTSTQRKEDQRKQFIDRARQPILIAAKEHIESATARYNDQLKRNGMGAIQDYAVAISDEAPRYTKSPTAIG